jgi:hypothetical protein
MPPQPTQRNRACERGAELIWRAALFEEGIVDALDVNAAILDRLDGVSDLHQPARSGVGISAAQRRRDQRSGSARRISWARPSGWIRFSPFP